MPSSLPSTAAARRTGDALYRAVWRWHFYAGLVCLPVLFSLALTGSLYLFKDEINRSVFAARTLVAPREGPTLSPERLVFIASEAVPDAVPEAYTSPEAPDRSALVVMAGPAAKTHVYLDPYDGRVLDRVNRDAEAMRVVRGLHSLASLGPGPNALVEIVAGFALILVVTGTYLWWPRGRRGGVVSVRGRPRQRLWWRDLHAVTGFVAGGGLFFLALTGLPWSIVWGDQLRAIANQAGLNLPTGMWKDLPVSRVPLGEVLDSAGWALEAAPLPRSRDRGPAPIGIDRAVAILGQHGMPAGYELALPRGAAGVYAATIYPRDPARQRMISLDQYSGRVLLDVRFSDIGLVGQAIQYAIVLHKGEYGGRINQFAMLAFCLATMLLAVTGAAAWWKRRPAGRLGIPPWPEDRRAVATVTGIVAGFGLAFPLTGLAILAMLALDLAGQAIGRARRRAVPA
ncbi:PepSY-associated TM helix domain-containing protein [Methylobacterium sp. JK268]